MDRRSFLRTSGMALGAMALGDPLLIRVARAAELHDRYLVFCYFEGGWDHLLGLDPRDPADYTDSVMVETGIQLGYELLPPQFPSGLINAGPFVFGPCIGELAELTDHFSVIRGINMATLTHEVGRRYFITGRPPSGLQARGSSVSSLATAQIGGELPVPNLALQVESYALDLPSFATAMPVAYVGQLQYVLRDTLGIATFVPSGVRDAIDNHWNTEVECGDTDGLGATALAQAYRENRIRAKALTESKLYEQFLFESDALASVRDHYGFTTASIESPFGRAALASQALKSGLSRVVSITLGGQLDTHDGTWATEHPVRLNDGFNSLARLLTDLRDTEAPGGGSFLSKTTIFAFSEFGRTGRLNSRGGRDHNLSNCALVGGAGVVPGLVIGSSGNGLDPYHIDLVTGNAVDVGISLKPEHIMTTVLHAAGLDAAELQSEPILALLAK